MFYDGFFEIAFRLFVYVNKRVPQGRICLIFVSAIFQDDIFFSSSAAPSSPIEKTKEKDFSYTPPPSPSCKYFVYNIRGILCDIRHDVLRKIMFCSYFPQALGPGFFLIFKLK